MPGIMVYVSETILSALIDGATERNMTATKHAGNILRAYIEHEKKRKGEN